MNPAFMEKKRILEKRKAERIPMSLRTEYKLLRGDGRLHETVCKNISGTGIRLRVYGPFKQGQYIKSLVYLPNDPTPVHILDKVIWCKRGNGPVNNFELGAEHMSVSLGDKDRERFIFFICESLIEHNLNNAGIETYGI